MRTDDSRPQSSNPSRIRGGLRQAWSRYADLAPRARWLAATIALATLVVAGYFATIVPTETNPSTWLFEGPGLSPEDARRALVALASAKIPATLGPRGQLAVPTSRRSDALALLVKQKLLPITLRDIQQEAANPSIMSWPTERGEQKERIREREAEVMIAELDGIDAADVRVHRASTRMPGARNLKVAALVRVQPTEARPLTPQTLQAIQSILRTFEPDMPSDALTILDRSGRPYLVAGNPEAGAAMMAHVRKEEIRSRILTDLNWIEGLRVLVSIDPPAEPIESHTSMSQATIVVNEPTDLAPPPPSAQPSGTSGKARILVQVPIGHYLRAFQAIHRREASLDDLKSYVPKVEDTIRATIQQGFPLTSEIASLKIDRIDAPGSAPPPVALDSSRAANLPVWLAPAAGGAVAAIVLAFGAGRWMLLQRRPPSHPAPVPRVHFEVPTESGPSIRVRDLVRRDPSAAAGVLGRWIGQGGSSS